MFSFRLKQIYARQLFQDSLEEWLYVQYGRSLGQGNNDTAFLNFVDRHNHITQKHERHTS